MARALVSVVTPCYNGEGYLQRFFDAIIAQGYRPIELVLVNDGSSDRTKEIAESYANRFEQNGIRFIYAEQKNAGQAAALNKGLQLYNGDYLLCMDSDDAISDRYIEECVKYLEEHEDCAYCGGVGQFIDDKTGQLMDKYVPKKREKKHEFFEDVLYVRDIFFSGYMVKAHLLKKLLRKDGIFTGQGGQNAQYLLPLAWYYSSPGIVVDAVYHCYVRSNSHSHSINDSRKVIVQLYNYEKILVETIERIADDEAKQYIPDIKKHYADLRFGNAVDTMDKKLIRKQFVELCSVKVPTINNFGLFMKYGVL